MPAHNARLVHIVQQQTHCQFHAIVDSTAWLAGHNALHAQLGILAVQKLRVPLYALMALIQQVALLLAQLAQSEAHAH